MNINNGLVAALITLIVGPISFFTLTRASVSKYTFPSTITGLLGDIVFLPLFNAAAIYYGLLDVLMTGVSWGFVVSLVLMLVFSYSYAESRIVRKRGARWMFNGSGGLNFVGLYHFMYTIAQSFIVAFSLLHFYDRLLMWIVLLGYFLTAGYVVNIVKKINSLSVHL